MKKLLTLFSFLAFFSLIFIGCQGTEDIIAPDDLSKPGPFVWGNPTTIPSPVDLIAGQFDKVGEVEITSDGTNLMFKYVLNEGCEITEMHIDLAYAPTDFHVNKNNSPVFGNFDSKNYASFDYEEYTVTFNATGLANALGAAPVDGQTIYMAIHGVVCCPTGEVTEAVCPDFTASATLDSWVNYGTSAPYQFGFTFSNPAFTADGWCVDLSKSLTGAAGKTFNFVCSYGTVSNCIVRVPANLSKANWIINNRDGYAWPAVQMALWELLSPYQAGDYMNPYLNTLYTESGYETLIEQATAWENENGPFVPSCGENVLVLGYDGSDPCARGYQSIAYEVPAECESTCETAMAFPEEDAGNINATTSSLFNHQWFRYIAFEF
jgi:hypothetical protein